MKTVAPLRTYFSKIIFALLIISAISCKKKEPAIKSNDPVFSMDIFEQNVKNGLLNETLGFCYVISKDGNEERSGAFGRRIAGLDGSVSQSINEPMYCASMSKAITAVAALHVMKKKSITIYDPFYTYLPPTWNPGPNIKKLTFRHLLQHKSGIKEGDADYLSLQSYVEDDISFTDTFYNYQNSNFSLFRILIPYMNGDILPTLTQDNVIDGLANKYYVEYVENNLFSPISININNTDVKPVGSNPTLYYNFPDFAGTRGWDIGDRTSISGGGGWYISPVNVARFFAYLRFTDDIISASNRELMNNNYLGWDRSSSVSSNNDWGIYYAKNGSLTNGGADNQGVSNLVKNFPNGVQIVVMINSRGGDHDSQFGSTTLNSLIRDAFDNAWVEN